MSYQLSSVEEQFLFSLVAKGNLDARIKLYECMKDDVVRVARTFKCKCFTEDLEHEALEVLWKCTGSFRVGRGASFSTYSINCVHRAVGKMAASMVGVFRLPESAMEDRRAVLRAIADYQKEYGCEPSTAYLAQTLGLREDRVSELRTICPYVDEADAYFFDTDGSESQQKQYASDVRSDAAFEQGDFWQTVAAPLKGFSQRDRAIFAAIHPQDGSEPATTKELAERFGLTPQRVRQIDARMLTALREDLDMQAFVEAA